MQRPSLSNLRAGTWKVMMFLSAALLVPGCGDEDGPIDPPTTIPLFVHVHMEPQYQYFSVSRAGSAVTDAVVTVNGIGVPHIGTGSYERALPDAVPAGTPLHLKVTAAGVTVEAAVSAMDTPVITSPAAGSVLAKGDSITVTWTSTTDPDIFSVSVLCENREVNSTFLPGTTRELKVSVSGMVHCYKNGAIGFAVSGQQVDIRSFTGPAESGSAVGFWSRSAEAVATFMPGINRVAVTAPAYVVAVGSPTQMAAVVDADPGVEYTLTWSLPAGTTAATIDASSGVLTTLARGFVAPRACATVNPSSGESQTMCGETMVGVVTDAAVGSGLAFVRERAVFESPLDGSAPFLLVSEATSPAWSPDGARIAFARPSNDQVDSWPLCVAWADGSDIRCAATAKRAGDVHGGPSWSPDGVKVAFSVGSVSCGKSQCDGGLFVLNTVSMGVDTIKIPPLTSVSWSPDGRKIAFANGYELGIMNPDGSEMAILEGSLGGYSVSDVAWSPDGRRLALGLWACPWDCHFAIGIVNGNGTDLKVLVNGGAGTPTWSPDGTLVAYTRWGYECGYGSTTDCERDIMVIGADGTGPVILITNGHSPSWRP